MAKTDFKKLKSGTDIRAVASKGPSGEDIELTDEVIEKIALAFLQWLNAKTHKSAVELSISVGHDSRVSSQRIKSVIISTLASRGVSVSDCALASTPAMFMTTRDLNCDAAIQITASHHPSHKNGLKFFTKSAGIDSSDLDEILNLCESAEIPTTKNTMKVQTVDYMSVYSAHLREIICRGLNKCENEQPLEGLKIVVDAGNGAGGFFATKVLAPLGADVSGSQFLEPDGTFPNHIPNPESPEAMNAAAQATLGAGADLGIIFDTDVDRAAIIDDRGKEINRNRLVALASEIALEKRTGGTIVTDSVTSSGLTHYIEAELSGTHHRFKRGYKNVINEAIRLNEKGQDCPLAIETSGHAAFRENNFLDDGAYLATKIIVKMVKLREQGRNLSDLLRSLPEPAETLEFRLPIIYSDFKVCGEEILKKLTLYAKEQNITLDEKGCEGVRLCFDLPNERGWCLLRLSVHDPIMPLNVESDVAGGSAKILKRLLPFFAGCEGLDGAAVGVYLDEK